MDTKETKYILSAQLEGRTLTVGDQIYTVDFALCDYIFLELLDRYNISLDFVNNEKISNYLTQIESTLNGKLVKFRLLGNTITNQEVRALKSRYFETYVKVKLDSNRKHHFINDFEPNNGNKPIKLKKESVLMLTIESSETTIARKIAFLKQGIYEIMVFDANSGTHIQKMKTQLKLDLNDRLIRGIWVDTMVLNENNILSLRCVKLFSREILLEEERGERQHGL